MVRKALEAHGIEGEIVVLTDGEMAIRYIQSLDGAPTHSPHLAIVDLNLPRKPGREVIECIRRSQTLRNVPIIVLSSSDAVQDREEAARLGVTRYLRKPAKLAEFLALGAIFRETLPPNQD